jgi:DNA-binding transcriptional regulator GbsR (MarR family)
LLALGCIRKVWEQEKRKDHFVAVLELGDLIRSAYDSIFRVRADNAERHLKDMVETLTEEKDDMSHEEHALIKERLQRLVKMQKRAKKVLPILERLIK